MRVLLTGATGRVGKQLMSALLERGDNVRAVVLPGDSALDNVNEEALEVVAMDLRSPRDLRSCLEGIEAVVHLAATMAWSSDASDELFEANVRATHLLLKEAAKVSPGLSRFVLASSDDTYPSLAHTTGLVTEDEPQHPVSFYGATKVVCEHLALHYWYAQAMPVVVTRFCLIARSEEIMRPDGWSGRFLFASSMAGFFAALGRPECAELIREASSGHDECLLLARDESGEPYSFHFADVRDIVAGIQLALDRPESTGEIFNLAGPEPFSYGDAVPSLSRAAGIPFVDVSLPGPPIRVRLDINKAKTRLGYKPIWTVEAVIADAAGQTLAPPERLGQS